MLELREDMKSILLGILKIKYVYIVYSLILQYFVKFKVCFNYIMKIRYEVVKLKFIRVV